MADVLDLRSIPLTVYATLAEWVAHFQVSSLQNFFAEIFREFCGTRPFFDRCSNDLTRASSREGEAPVEPPQEIGLA